MAVLLMVLAANFAGVFLVLTLGVAFAEIYGGAAAAETSLLRMFETWGRILSMGADAMSEVQERSVLAPALVFALSILPAVVVAPALRVDPAGGRGWSLKASAAAAVLLGSVGALGILVAGWEVVVLAMVPPTGEITREMLWLDWPVLLIVAWLTSGAGVAWLLRRAGSADPSDRIARMVRWLFVGTCVELAIAAPTLAVATRRDTCVCAWGSYCAVVAGVASLGSLCGPAVLLLLARRSRRNWLREVCPICARHRPRGAATCRRCQGQLP